jgi:blue copper oxidase
MKRRDFVSLVTMAMGTSVLWSCRKDFMNSSEHLMVKPGGGAVGTRFPLKIPTTVTFPSANPFQLASAPATSNLGGGLMSNVWAYNGQFPGPTLIARKGDQVQINLKNNLSEETITHWHGMIVDHQNDGQPMQAIAPGDTYNYNYVINQRACLNFYHPHPHMLTGKQVYLGQAGAFIIRDNEEDNLNLPSGTYEVPLIIRDATLDSNNNLSYKPSSGGMFGKIPLVNGTRSPYLEVDRAVYRFRILNGANSRIFGLALSNGAPFKLIGNDGGLLQSAYNHTRIDISNGERLDVLVDFRSIPNGTSIMLRDMRSGWDLLEFRINSSTVISSNAMSLSALSSITPLPNVPTVTRTFSFDAMSKINGKVYNMDRIDFTVPFQTTERWRFRSNGNAPHPVHIHGASFQVVSRTGGRGRVFDWEKGWKDTVLLDDKETVDVLIRFDAHKGIYLIHCHKLEHEDMGMMANFEVV